MPATVIPGYTFISGDVLTATRLNLASAGSVPNATSLALGVVQLTGDLAGIASAPGISLSLISTYGRTLTASADAAAARAILGLGTVSTSNTINGSMWSGQDLAVADGGTGASDAATARTNLGAQKQAINLDQIAAIAQGDGVMIVSNGVIFGNLPTEAFGRSLLNADDEFEAQGILNLSIGSDVQAYSPNLTSLAAVSPATGTMLFHNGSAYASTPSLTFGRSLLNLADAAAARAAIGVPASNIYLDQIAAITPSNGTMLFYNGANYASTPSASFGRALLNTTDTTTAASALGLSPLATQTLPVPVASGGTGNTVGSGLVQIMARWDGSGTNRVGLNVAIVVKDAVGQYTVNYAITAPVYYLIYASAIQNTSFSAQVTAITQTSCHITTRNNSSTIVDADCQIFILY